jgi:hypothetical protein
VVRAYPFGKETVRVIRGTEIALPRAATEGHCRFETELVDAADVALTLLCNENRELRRARIGLGRCCCSRNIPDLGRGHVAAAAAAAVIGADATLHAPSMDATDIGVIGGDAEFALEFVALGIVSSAHDSRYTGCLDTIHIGQCVCILTGL